MKGLALPEASWVPRNCILNSSTVVPIGRSVTSDIWVGLCSLCVLPSPVRAVAARLFRRDSEQEHDHVPGLHVRKQ